MRITATSMGASGGILAELVGNSNDTLLTSIDFGTSNEMPTLISATSRISIVSHPLCALFWESGDRPCRKVSAYMYWESTESHQLKHMATHSFHIGHISVKPKCLILSLAGYHGYV